MAKELSAEEFRGVLKSHMEQENERLSETNPGLGTFRILFGDYSWQTGSREEGLLLISRDGDEGAGPTHNLRDMRRIFNSFKITWDGGSEEEIYDLPCDEEGFFQTFFRTLEEQQERLLGAKTAEIITRYDYDPAAALNCLLPAVCNRFQAAEFLTMVPHRDLHDLAVYYRVTPTLRESNLPLLSYPVTNELMEQWNRVSFAPVTEGKLFDAAYENAVKVQKVTSFSHAFAETMSKVMSVGLAPVEDEKETACFLTNTFGVYGAAGSFLGIGLAEFSEEVSANLYLLPSSIHETLVYADNGAYSTKELAKMVARTNSHCVMEEEYLSGNVYYYDRETKKITVAYDRYSRTLTQDAPENKRPAEEPVSKSVENAAPAETRQTVTSKPAHRRR